MNECGLDLQGRVGKKWFDAGWNIGMAGRERGREVRVRVDLVLSLSGNRCSRLASGMPAGSEWTGRFSGLQSGSNIGMAG